MSDHPHLQKEERLRLQYDALTRQLERMRGMQYAYFSKFFWWVIVTFFVMIYLAIYPQSFATLALPFLVVTAGVQASFYLHFVDFARVHARALERKINQLVGDQVLLGAEIEDLYFYPLDHPKMSGLSYAKPLGFFSVYTLHWCGLWLFFYVVGVYLSVWILGLGDLAAYTLPYYLLLAVWTLGNVLYLLLYFGRGHDLKAVAARLAAAYDRADKNHEDES